MAFSHAVISEDRNVATKSFLHPRQGAARRLQQILVLLNLPSHSLTQMQSHMCDDSLLTINSVLETPESVYIYIYIALNVNQSKTDFNIIRSQTYEEITNQGD